MQAKRGMLTRAGVNSVAGLIAITGLALVIACREAVAPSDTTMAGQWVASNDPAQSVFTEASAFSFSLTQTDSMVAGTWGATGRAGVVVRPDQLVTGKVRGAQVELTLRYSRSDHGCTGAYRNCYELFYRVLGTISAAGVVKGRLVGPPHPTLPDADLQPFAIWTLRRQ